jgi:rubredoxin
MLNTKEFRPVTWEERLCKIGKNNFIKTLVEANTRNGKS